LTVDFNQSQRDIINNTWCVQNSTTFITVIGTTYYALPSDFITPIRVTSNFANVPETSLIQLDSLNGNTAWPLLSGTNLQYYFVDWSQATKTVNAVIGLYPYPQNNLSTTSVKIQYYATVPDLSAGGDVPFNNQINLYPYHDLLMYFAAYRIFLIEGEVDKANLYRQEYESRLGVMATAVGKRPNFIPGMTGPANSR
jgi:hypothetical protein